MATMRDRIASIKLWFEYRLRRIRQLPWTVLAILVGVAIASLLVGLRGPQQRWAGLWLNLGTELVGAVVTFVLLDFVLGTRQEKEALIAQMSSEIRDVAVPAAEKLNRRGWLYDGTLQGADLFRAQLSGANLSGGDLHRTNLASADLSSAYLPIIDLSKSILLAADLSQAQLDKADLSNAFLHSADLSESNLSNANLQGASLGAVKLHEANLEYANLRGAGVAVQQLAQAKHLTGATLPDGTKLSEDNWEAEFEEWRKKREEQESDD